MLVSVVILLATEGSEADETAYDIARELLEKVLALYAIKQQVWRRFCADLGFDPEK